MTTPLHNSIEQTYEELARQREALHDMQRRLAETGATVTSKNRAVSVTLDGQGNVIDIKFVTGAYRGMPPAELGTLLVATIAEARASVTGQVAEILEEMMPGSSMLDVLNGDFDLDEMMDEAISEAVSSQPFFNVGPDDADSGVSGGEEAR